MYKIKIKKKGAKKDFLWKQILLEVQKIAKPQHLSVEEDSLEFSFDKAPSAEDVKAIKDLEDKPWYKRIF